MSATQKILIVNNPTKSLPFRLPEQYDKPEFLFSFPEMFSMLETLYEKRKKAELRVEQEQKKGNSDYQELVMFLVLITCRDGEDLEIIDDLRFKYPDVPIVVSSSKNRYAALAALKDCGSMAFDADAGAFLRAEYQAYWLLMEKKKKAQAMKKTG